MGRIFICVLLFLTLGSFTGNKKPGGDDIIIWSKNYRLKWSDYKPVKYSTGIADASSDVTIRYQPLKCKSADSVDLYIYSCFIKKDSYVMADYTDSLGLEHERHHFDLCEVYARKLRQRAIKMPFDVRDFTSVYTKMVRQLEREQDSYDRAIYGNGNIMNSTNQIKWDKTIDKELKQLDAYSNPHVMVKIKRIQHPFK